MTRWTQIVEQSLPGIDPDHYATGEPKTVDVKPHVRKAPRRQVDDPETLSTSRGLDHSTSRAAGLRNVGRRGGQRRKIAMAFLFAWPLGLTDEEACRLAAIPLQSSPWKRCTELRQWGYLEDTGLTKPTDTGSPAKVWKVTAAGREELLLERPAG